MNDEGDALSPQVDQQNQVVHGHQLNIGVMHGDIIYRRVELEAPLREVFDFLFEDRRFGGRHEELARISDFLRRESGGYLAISAPAGFGKTSLLAELVSSHPEAFSYHFFTAQLPRSLSEEFFLRNVVQQMAAWHGEEGNLPPDMDMLLALYHKYLDQQLKVARILVLDGLDEIQRWQLQPYLRRRLPPHLLVIVTIRDVGQDWRQQFGFPPDQLEHLPLGGLGTADIAAVLTAAGGLAVDLAADQETIANIGRIALYDETLPHLGADPFYVAFLAGDLAGGAMNSQDLARQPRGLEGYLDQWWSALKESLGDEATGVAPLSEAFLVVLARLLAPQLGLENHELLRELLPNVDARQLLTQHRPAPPLASGALDKLVAQVEPPLTHFEQLAAAGESEAVMSVMPMLEEEARSGWLYEGDMRQLLWQLAADIDGWPYIERFLATILPNPYIEYRDIGLAAIGRATLAAPLENAAAQDWLRVLWQRMLLTTLDQEGVSFTFDLPMMLVNEAERRDEAMLPALVEYTNHALSVYDKCGTRMRAQSALAAEKHYAGATDAGGDLLSLTAYQVHGYAGFATGHLLAIANRWLEIGQPQRFNMTLAPYEQLTLLEKLHEQAGNVRDAAFRRQLLDLIDSYHAWHAAPQPPPIEQSLTNLRALDTRLARDVYIDFLSASWAQAADSALTEGLKALLPLALDRGTVVDSLMARLLRAYLVANGRLLDGGLLWEAQLLTEESLTTGRPWS